MTRYTVAVLLVLCAALAGVVAGAVRLVRQDRAELVERFGAERRRVITEAARELGEDLDDVAASLRFAAQIFRDPETAREPERELRALRAAVKEYRLLRVYDGRGALLHAVGDKVDAPDVPPDDVRAIEAAITEAAKRAASGVLDGPVEAVAVSSVSGRGWSRVFALPFSRRAGGQIEGVVVALIDMRGVFDKLHLLSSDGSRVLLLGGPGEPTAASDAELAAAISRAEDGRAASPRFGELVRRMRDGEEGTLAIGESEGGALGLGAVESIAAFHGIAGSGSGSWSIASFSSTAALRSHERGLVLRLTGAAGAVALLLLAFGAYLVVTSRRQVAIRERLRHAEEIRHLHEKTEKILESIPTGVMSIGDDGRITAANRALREKIPAESIGAGIATAFPDAPAAVVARIVTLVESARGAGGVRSLPAERLALFGEEGQYILHALPLEPRFPDSSVILVIEDVSEVRQLASQLLRAEKLATIGVLAAGIAHEIGTPLGVVRGRAEYIQGKLGPSHPQAQGLGVIVEQIDRVSRTIRQLLDFARVKPAQVRTVAVAPVARAVAELLRYEAERREVDIAVEAADDLPMVMADPDQLQQVLVNLAMNALDACAAGGHVRLRGAAQPVPDDGWRRVRIEVVDDGCGIPDELKLQIFDPFFTTKKRGQGTGLGLTMAADIVRSHGADIEVESEPGKGTRMILRWPTEAVTQSPSSPPPPSQAPASSPPPAIEGTESPP